MKKIIVLSFLFAAGFSAYSQQPVDLITVRTYRDSTKELAVSSRFIQKNVKTDSITKIDAIVVDTIWAVKFIDPIIDPKTKKQAMEKGKPKWAAPRYIQFPSDSIRWKGIEGVPLDKLLDKKTPPKG